MRRYHIRPPSREFGSKFEEGAVIRHGMDGTPQMTKSAIGNATRLELFTYHSLAAQQDENLVAARPHLARHVAHVNAGAAYGIRTRDYIRDPHGFLDTITRNASFRNKATLTAVRPGTPIHRARSLRTRPGRSQRR
jgi:hypothetical protein